LIQCRSINYIISSGNTAFFDLLRPEYFSDYPDEFKFIQDHYSKYNRIPDMSTFLDSFEDFDVMSVSEPPEYFIKELKRDKTKRDLIEHYKKIGELISQDKVEEAVDFNKAAANDLGRSTDVSYINLLDATDRYEKYLDRCENRSKYFIKTGFTELDEALGGWDALEELGVISARPNVGKSQIVIKCATAAVEQGLIVGIYSGEMSEEKVGYRSDTMLANIPNWDLTRGDQKSQVTYKKYVDELPYKYSGQYWCLTPKELGGPATVSDLKRFIEDKNLDILFVDQHSLLEDQHHARDPIQRAANISKDLKNLQVLLKKPIIAVSQQNRGAVDDDDIIGVDHLSQSDRIGQDATTVIFLTCKNNILNIIISKSRDCEKDKKLSYAIDWNTGRFDFLQDPDDEDGNDREQEVVNDGEGAVFH